MQKPRNRRECSFGQGKSEHEDSNKRLCVDLINRSYSLYKNSSNCMMTNSFPTKKILFLFATMAVFVAGELRGGVAVKRDLIFVGKNKDPRESDPRGNTLVPCSDASSPLFEETRNPCGEGSGGG
jgi:hypothetical protein